MLARNSSPGSLSFPLLCTISAMFPAFALPAQPPQLPSLSYLRSTLPRYTTRFYRKRTTTATLLSVPFPLPDLFAFPSVAFTNSTAAADFRPELIGSLLWTTGLYLGFSQHVRWGSAALSFLTTRLVTLRVPKEISESIAAATHSLPFLAAGFGIDAVLRYANGSNAIWALASGVSLAMYGGIYELGRRSAKGKKVSEDESDVYSMFEEFASRRLVPRGMCHLIDVRAAVREDSKARRLNYISDERLRRFIRNRFPKARRSPNGYYRGVSVRQNTDPKRVSSMTRTEEKPR